MTETNFSDMMSRLEGKWKIFILNKLAVHGTQRYKELKAFMPEASDQLLTNKLKELEQHQLICREMFGVVPPKVEYSITAKGLELNHIIILLDSWAKDKPVNFASKYDQCEVGYALNFISGKWKLFLLNELKETRRFMELKHILPEITKKILTSHLKELEADGLVSRVVYPEIPPKVEYSLTEQGKALIPMIDKLKAWSIYVH